MARTSLRLKKFLNSKKHISNINRMLEFLNNLPIAPLKTKNKSLASSRKASSASKSQSTRKRKSSIFETTKTYMKLNYIIGETSSKWIIKLKTVENCAKSYKKRSRQWKNNYPAAKEKNTFLRKSSLGLKPWTITLDKISFSPIPILSFVIPNSNSDPSIRNPSARKSKSMTLSW